MASYSVAAGKRGAYDKALVASTVDTVTFTDDVDSVEIVTDGTAKIYVTVDGTTPTVSGATTIIVPAALGIRTIPTLSSGAPVVKLITSGTPTYSVAKAS